MKNLWAVIVVVATSVAAAATADAQTHAASGDTCKATGNGTSFTLRIAVPSGSTQQFGFAFGVPGATVTNAVIPGTNGTFATTNLAANTTGAWISESPLTGAVDATLTVSGTRSGTIMVVPASSSKSTYLAPVRCTFAEARVPAAALTVGPHVTYSAAEHAWHLAVKIPGPGTVSAIQPEPTIGTASSKSVTAKSLVQVRRVVSKSARTVTLTLRPTAGGQADLSTSGKIELKLRVTFDSKEGTSATKVVHLSLTR